LNHYKNITKTIYWIFSYKKRYLQMCIWCKISFYPKNVFRSW